MSPVYVQKKMPCRITFDGKGTVGGGTRECVRLSEHGVFRSVMEEELEENGKDWSIGITEVETELGKANDCISYQITVLVRVKGHSGQAHQG